MKPWLWPDRTIGKRESRALREEHNAAVEEHVKLERAAAAVLHELDRGEKPPTARNVRWCVSALREAMPR